MRQEVVLALLAKEPTYGYELRARLSGTLFPYTTLFRSDRKSVV